MRFRQFRWRNDFGAWRTIGNCLLAGLVLAAGAVFFSCHEQIVVESTPQMNAEQPYMVRVLLADDVNHCAIKMRGGFGLFNSDGSVLIPGTTFTERGQLMNVAVSGGEFTIGGRRFAAREITILPDEPFTFVMDGNEFRGKLLLKANVDGQTFEAIDIVPLEPYLAGVVGAEMPDRWEAEALKAQAIAARTYCLYNKKKFGLMRDWDVARTQTSQVYLGLKGESASVWRAVNETSGEVLMCEQAGLPGAGASGEELFPAYYSSSCGGHTEDAKNVFGDSFGPLGGVECPYCRAVARPDVFFWPMVQFNKGMVTTAVQKKYPQLKGLGDIANISAVKQSDYPDFSRITMVKLTGSNGRSEFLRAEDLRLTIDPAGNRIRSVACKIAVIEDKVAFLAGRGFGHGVGMCQCGAQGMAMQGKTANEILQYYYPGSKLVRAY
ncbi:MAG: SpoIID/LytB domain-containing protein [Sedimentisphaerales bacterium]